MDLRGLTRFSLIDYPGKMACVAFAAGCNFRCAYCQNPVLVLQPETQPPVSREELFGFLERRRGKLDAIVFSGGEPTLQPDLPELATECKRRGFLVKVDTNGSRPEIVRTMLATGTLDALAVDYKAPARRYAEVAACNCPDLLERVRATLTLAASSGLLLDVRTTVHREVLSRLDLRQMREELTALGIGAWTLQQFHPVPTLSPELAGRPTYSDRELAEIAAELDGGTRARGLRLNS